MTLSDEIKYHNSLKNISNSKILFKAKKPAKPKKDQSSTEMVRPIVNGIVKEAMNKAENDQAQIGLGKGSFFHTF